MLDPDRPVTWDVLPPPTLERTPSVPDKIVDPDHCQINNHQLDVVILARTQKNTTLLIGSSEIGKRTIEPDTARKGLSGINRKL
jgi:hypothetical protein